MEGLKKRWNELEISNTINAADAYLSSGSTSKQKESSSNNNNNNSSPSPSSSSSTCSSQNLVLLPSKTNQLPASAQSALSCPQQPTSNVKKPETMSIRKNSSLKEEEEDEEVTALSSVQQRVMSGSNNNIKNESNKIKKDLSNLSTSSSTTTSSYRQDSQHDEEGLDEFDFSQYKTEKKEENFQCQESLNNKMFKKTNRQSTAEPNKPKERDESNPNPNPDESDRDRLNSNDSMSKVVVLNDDRNILSSLNDDAFFMLNSQKVHLACSQTNEFFQADKLTKIYKKTPSLDSIKSKTIVTPIELEPNLGSEDLRKEVNIIKLESGDIDNNEEEEEEEEDEQELEHEQRVGKEKKPPVHLIDPMSHQDCRNLPQASANHNRAEHLVPGLIGDQVNDEHESILKLANDVSSNKSRLNKADNKSNETAVGTHIAAAFVTESATINPTTAPAVASFKDDNEIVLNDLFDWLLWIDHTLQSQVITVGNLDEIQQSINKYDVSDR